jgi:4-amino-4-deoxy-L-arabinose transferase-like glycosyltransferase
MSVRDVHVGAGARWVSPGRAALVVAAIALPLFFVKLGSASLVDPDEPYYAVPALEMLKSGTWSVTLFHGQPWFDKPILFYWAVLAAFKTFGVTEWSARLASALTGTLGAIALAVWAPRGWRVRGTHLLGAVVLATSLEYALLARSAVTDMMLTFFLTLGFLAAARWLESGKTAAAAAAGVAFGLATLTKGPVGIVVPALALVLYGAATRRREMLRVRPLAAAAGGFAIAALPWYAYMLAFHRALVLDVFLGSENLGRFLHPEHRQLPFFYVTVFALGLMPWSAALPAGLVRAWRAWRGRDEGPGASPGLVYAGCWFASVVVIFSLSASKLLTYVLPAFPPAAILIAAYWTEMLPPKPAGARVSRGAIAVAASGAAVAFLAGVAAIVAAHAPRFAEVKLGAYVLAAVLIAGAIGALAAVRAGRLAALATVQAGLAWAVVLAVILVAWPRMEERESTKGLVSRLQARGLDGDLVAAFHVPDVSLDFYLGRTLRREIDETKLKDAVASDPGRLWVVKSEELDAIAARQDLAVERIDVSSRRWVVRLTPRAEVATLGATP